MREKRNVGKGLVVAVILAVVLAAAGTGFCEGSKKVAVFPFTMNSPQDLGFLQNGLFSMLSSRLADPGKVEVMDREAVDKVLAAAQTSDLTKGAMTEDKARMIGAGMGADFVLFGSLTHFGESVSLDARMVDVAGQKQTLAFFEQSNAMGDVIPLVNTFAGDINEKVFNRRIDNQLYAKPEVPEEAAAPGGLQNAGGAGMYGGGMMTMQASQGFLTHLKVDDVIRAMATGDVDKDGKLEVVIATDYELFIYSFEGTLLKLEKKLEYPSHLRIVSLDVADINGNGFPEIFVSSLTVYRENIESFVVEYDGSAYKTLVDGESVYYRVVNQDKDSRVLMGQAKDADPFTGKIFLMTPDGNAYNRGKGIRMPRNTSVLSLAKGPVTGDVYEEYLGINRHDRLVAIDSAGGQSWESSLKYGGTNNDWLMPRRDTDATYREHVYFHPRVKFYAVGEDAKPKAFVVKNDEIGGGVFGRFKKFSEGHMEIMAWNGIAMGPVFQTMPVQGWISDFDIADIDGDGSDELVVSVVTRTKLAILSKDKSSNIISYKLK